MCNYLIMIVIRDINVELFSKSSISNRKKRKTNISVDADFMNYDFIISHCNQENGVTWLE